MSEIKCILPAHYSDDYYLRLWRAAKKYQAKQTRICKRPYGAWSYFEEMRSVIEANAKTIKFPGQRTTYWRPSDFPKVEKPYAYKIREFLETHPENSGEPKHRKRRYKSHSDESLKVIRCFDAFFQLTDPAYAATFGGQRNTKTAAHVLAEYQADQSLINHQYDLAIIIQNICGIYAYHDRDSIFRKAVDKRYLSISHENEDRHLTLIDYQWPSSNDHSKHDDLKLNLYYGFAIPGRYFSPVVLRSWKWGHRQNGMLHFDNALVSLRHLPPKRFYLFSHTTEGEKVDLLEHEKRRADTQNTAEARGNLLAKQTLLIHQGPQVRKELTREKNAPLINRMNEMLGKIKKDYL